MKGRWITLDGIDGAGKSTQLEKIASWLENLGLQVVRTREPGGTAVGEDIRAIFLRDLPQLATEALLLFAARQELLDTVIKPALVTGKWVVSDRSSDATYAYQGAEGLEKHKIRELENFVFSFRHSKLPSTAITRIFPHLFKIGNIVLECGKGNKFLSFVIRNSSLFSTFAI